MLASLCSSFWKKNVSVLLLLGRGWWLHSCYHWRSRDKAEACFWNWYSWHNWHWPGTCSLWYIYICTVFLMVQWLNGFRSLWQVAMSVNDIVTSGAKPLSFQDYYHKQAWCWPCREGTDIILCSLEHNIIFSCSFYCAAFLLMDISSLLIMSLLCFM